jgi:hypothetical protein
MGTSTSYRAPNRPKWNAFNAALSGEEEPRRVASEMFNAGEEWELALSSPAIAVFAEAAAGLPDALVTRLREGEVPAAVVRGIADDTTAASLDAGFSPALAMAQRSFVRLLLGILGGIPDEGTQLDRSSVDRDTRPGALSADYLSELTVQFARHAIDRESGRLAARQANWTSGSQQLLADRVSGVAGTMAHSVALESFGVSVPTSSSWSAAVRRVFEIGRQLPTGAERA